jgi:hypothetical protein
MVAINCNSRKSVEISFPSEFKDGTRMIGRLNDVQAIYIPNEDAVSTGERYFADTNQGSMTIHTYDDTLGIVEGTFELIGTPFFDRNGTLITVTEGSFSLDIN